MKRKSSSVTLLTLTGLFAAMITLTTAYLCHIPYGSNGGYIHFGDALIYIAAVFLPQPYALTAAAIGAGLADLLTAPAWMPATIIIKILITFSFTSQSESIMFGSFLTPMTSIFGNIIQGIGSMCIFFFLSSSFDHMHIKNRTLIAF